MRFFQVLMSKPNITSTQISNDLLKYDAPRALQRPVLQPTQTKQESLKKQLKGK